MAAVTAEWTVRFPAVAVMVTVVEAVREAAVWSRRRRRSKMARCPSMAVKAE
jgi:hypothetical protein